MKRLGLFFVITLALVSPRAGLSQAKVQRSVSDATVEKILTGLELKFQKVENKGKGKDTPSITHFDFASNRLNDFFGDSGRWSLHTFKNGTQNGPHRVLERAKRKILIQYSRRLIEVPGSGNELQPAVNDPDARACACKTGDKKFDLIRRSARRVF